ncbi:MULTISPECIES: hypothetical protein [Streptomyces]|uniref:Secreted protein n=1 Tax=Streptomyces xanthii TaxID=2768069 RepID=A0A7H1BJ45_9ACTN|nr:hypothetical protein [Streptomyces xanthii]QNS08750.1 hypothetical protein IAG42_15520 [Streptomyces xanthii]
MKVLKAAAVVAGSLTLAGAAAPAFAADATPAMPPMSLNGAVNEITSQPTLDVEPVNTNLLDPKRQDNAIGTVTTAAQALNSGGGLLGGVPVGK